VAKTQIEGQSAALLRIEQGHFMNRTSCCGKVDAVIKRHFLVKQVTKGGPALKLLFCIVLGLVMMKIDGARAQEFANFARYAQANSVLGPAAGSEMRVVFMGDSITEGWSPSSPEFFEGKPYINRGISGQVTSQMLIRFRPDVIDLNPAAVVILAGTNDIAENKGPTTTGAILGNIASMAELARANDIEVIICSVLPAYDYPWRPGLNPNIKIPRLNERLKAYAEANEFMYLDYFSEMNDGNNAMIEAYTTDGVHLTTDGYEVMGRLVENALAIVTAH